MRFPKIDKSIEDEHETERGAGVVADWNRINQYFEREQREREREREREGREREREREREKGRGSFTTIHSNSSNINKCRIIAVHGSLINQEGRKISTDQHGEDVQKT